MCQLIHKPRNVIIHVYNYMPLYANIYGNISHYMLNPPPPPNIGPGEHRTRGTWDPGNIGTRGTWDPGNIGPGEHSYAPSLYESVCVYVRNVCVIGGVYTWVCNKQM